MTDDLERRVEELLRNRGLCRAIWRTTASPGSPANTYRCKLKRGHSDTHKSHEGSMWHDVDFGAVADNTQVDGPAYDLIEQLLSENRQVREESLRLESEAEQWEAALETMKERLQKSGEEAAGQYRWSKEESDRANAAEARVRDWERWSRVVHDALPGDSVASLPSRITLLRQDLDRTSTALVQFHEEYHGGHVNFCADRRCKSLRPPHPGREREGEELMTCQCGHKHTQHYYDDAGREPCKYCPCTNFRTNGKKKTTVAARVPKKT